MISTQKPLKHKFRSLKKDISKPQVKRTYRFTKTEQCRIEI